MKSVAVKIPGIIGTGISLAVIIGFAFFFSVHTHTDQGTGLAWIALEAIAVMASIPFYVADFVLSFIKIFLKIDRVFDIMLSVLLFCMLFCLAAMSIVIHSDDVTDIGIVASEVVSVSLVLFCVIYCAMPVLEIISVVRLVIRNKKHIIPENVCLENANQENANTENEGEIE